jgi:predicted acylesterase/phospholipase RssA
MDMVITNAKYHKGLITDEVVGVSATIDGYFMSVPLDEENRHYAEILKQVADGTITIQEAD